MDREKIAKLFNLAVMEAGDMHAVFHFANLIRVETLKEVVNKLNAVEDEEPGTTWEPTFPTKVVERMINSLQYYSTIDTE